MAEFAEADIALMVFLHITVHTSLQYRFTHNEALDSLWNLEVCETKALKMYQI